MQHHRYAARRENKVGMRADDMAREVGIVLSPPLAGVSLHNEVTALNKSMAAQLLKKSAKKCSTFKAHVSNLYCRADNRDAFHV